MLRAAYGSVPPGSYCWGSSGGGKRDCSPNAQRLPVAVARSKAVRGKARPGQAAQDGVG